MNFRLNISLTTAVLLATFGQLWGAVTTHTASGVQDTDTWNIAGSWDNGIPSNVIDVVIGDGKFATCFSVSTPVYTGSVVIGSSSTLCVKNNTADINALGTGLITMYAGAVLKFRSSQTRIVANPMVLLGNASLNTGSSTAGSVNSTFSGSITGGFNLSLSGNGGSENHLNASNELGNVTASAVSGNSWDQNWEVYADAVNSLSAVSITMNTTVSLVINANNAFDQNTLLYLNGAKSSGVSAKLILNADAAVKELWIDGVQQADGKYTSSETWLDGVGILKVGGPKGTVILVR